MADPLEELSARLARIEALLTRQAGAGARVDAAPPARSTRSIVGRLDDVWVAVTEGNQRLTGALDDLRAVLADGPTPVADHRDDPAVDPALHLRLNRIEEALAGIADHLRRLGATDPAEAPPPAAEAGPEPGGVRRRRRFPPLSGR